jgi:hypothetical protein
MKAAKATLPARTVQTMEMAVDTQEMNPVQNQAKCYNGIPWWWDTQNKALLTYYSSDEGKNHYIIYLDRENMNNYYAELARIVYKGDTEFYFKNDIFVMKSLYGNFEQRPDFIVSGGRRKKVWAVANDCFLPKTLK